jgi:hypothetical protein
LLHFDPDPEEFIADELDPEKERILTKAIE